MTDEEFWKFVEEHRNDDTSKLRMKYRGNEEIFDALNQIDLEKKSADKFTGKATHPRRLHSKLAVEQSTASEIAQFHAHLAEGAHMILDMTMGLGTDAMAFASLPDTKVTAIEQNIELAEVSRKNYENIKNLEIVCGNSPEWLKETDRQFDLIFLDPARRDSDGNRVYNLHDCTPDVVDLLPLIFNHSPKLMVKCSPMLDITSTIKELRHCTGIYVIQQFGECRELLATASSEVVINERDVPITAKIGNIEFTFTMEEEASATGRYSMPREGEYLYEPAPAIMKCGPFKMLCERYGVTAISQNSHLYLSEKQIPDFPGKCMEIIGVEAYSSGNLKRFKSKWGNASVTVRNFTQTAEKLRGQLKVKENDQQRVIGTTDCFGNPILIICRPIQ